LYDYQALYPMYPQQPYMLQTQYIQIPQLPILGHNHFMKLIQDIHKAIVGEATAAEFYSRLLKEAPDELHEEFIAHARDDELEHLKAFTKLYRHLTGCMPNYTVEPVKYSCYKEGILMSLKDELKAGEFYRDVILSTTDQLVKDTFFLAMVDELEHATQFGVLYNTLR